MTLQPETFLGSGTFSNVYLFEKDGKKYARKKVPLLVITGHNTFESFP